MKKTVTFISVIILLLLSGCSNSTINTLAFEFDDAGNYSGFENLPADYNEEAAKKDGCYVRDMINDKIYGNQLWDDFIKNTKDGKESSIRIVLIFDDITAVQDLFYVDGYYRIFESSGEDLQDNKFEYLLILEGRLPNAAKGGTAIILTNDNKLTYDDIMWNFLSSTYNPISPFKLVMLY